MIGSNEHIFFLLSYCFLNFRMLLYFLYRRFLLVIHFIHISVYMSIPISKYVTQPPPPPAPLSPLGGCTLVLPICVSILPWKTVHLYHFSRLHIYAFTYDICFSLSDWLHSVWHSLDPSTPVPMNQLSSFLWLSNIPWYMYIPHLLYVFVCQWVFRLFPWPAYCK